MPTLAEDLTRRSPGEMEGRFYRFRDSESGADQVHRIVSPNNKTSTQETPHFNTQVYAGGSPYANSRITGNYENYHHIHHPEDPIHVGRSSETQVQESETHGNHARSVGEYGLTHVDDADD